MWHREAQNYPPSLLFLGGLPAEVGMEVDGSKPVQEMCGVVAGPTNTIQLSKEAFTPAHDILSARYSGLGSWFLFSWFMQRKGAQRYGPSGVGVSMGCLCSAGRAVACVR